MNIEVVKISLPGSSRKNEFYIGRPSILGNPYRIGVDGTREEVIKKYEKYIRKRIAKKDEAILCKLHTMIAEGRESGNIYLLCWCAPLSCHGDVIKKILLEMIDGKTGKI